MRHEHIHDTFSQVAAACADRTALDGGTRQVTYRELDEAANRLAQHLISTGATKGTIVSLLLEDAVEVVVAIIGVLKAGCVFAPLDPRTPEERLRMIVAEIAPRFFITEASLLPRLDRITDVLEHRAGVIRAGAADFAATDSTRLDILGAYAAHPHAARPTVETDPDEMCYIYFTSGSTGRPKGIAGRLKAIGHFIRWEIKTLGVGAGTRVSQLTAPSFDAYLRDIFTPLCAGGTVCLPALKLAAHEPQKLVAWLDEARVEVVHCVPSLLRALINQGLRPEQFAALRSVLLAGEPVLPADVKTWFSLFGARIQLVNLYGPTETTMTKFYYFIQPADQDRTSIPIGKPMEGARALVVDERGRSCPAGIVGEILIRTPFRTLGYYKQPEATAAVFIKNPFTDDPNDLVYKTGDFGRVLKDGNFEFLGRKDQQVKIRGVRIELSEVASLLRAHTAVEDVAVIDREDGAGNKFLCAYVVLRAAVATTELQAYLSARLPEYMTPSAYVVLDELPRTLNGKIDRRALPAPGRSAAEAGRTLVAPRTPLEQAVAQLWCDALNLDQIGVDENFFTLGAHSLLATQVLSRLRAAFGIELPLRSLFEAPTVAGLAARIETARAQTDGQTSPGAQTQPGAQPPLRRVSRAGALPASFAQQRLWFLDQLNPGDATYNVPVAVRLKGRLCAATLQQSLVEIVNRHEALRTIFAAQAGQPVQVVSDTCSLAWQSCDLSALAEPARAEQATRLAADAARRPFDLATGPLLRVVLMRLDEAEHVALLVVHHIVSDGWSMGLLVKELAALYENFAGGRPSPLAELPIQYADFAHWQREWLQGAALDAQLQAWRRLLGDKLPAWQLPTDRPRGVAGHGRGGVYEQTLDRELCAALQALTNDEGATLFMTLLTAFQVLLHRWTGQTELTVGTDIANRNRVETESLIGFFVNILVMRADASGDPAFRELLARARGQVLESYAHQDLPFSKLVEALRPERTLSRTPLVPVLFVLQNAPLPALELAGLKLDAFEVAQEAARFELALFITETPDGACAKWKYSADLFDQETIARLADRFTALLKSIVARPDARLSDLNMLTEDERRKQAQAHGTLQAHKLSKLMNVRLRGRGDGAQGQSDARQL